MRGAGFAIGLREGQDAAALLGAGYGATARPATSAFKHLLSARKADWEKFDGFFDAFWLGKRVRSRLDGGGYAARPDKPPQIAARASEQRGRARRADQVPSAGEAAAGAQRRRPLRGRVARGEPRRDGSAQARRPPAISREAHAVAARLAQAMRARLTRRDLARRRGYRLDLRRTIHRNISHGGVPISLVRRRRKEKPLRLVVLLDASGSMSMYTAHFLRFIHGVLDEFREAEAFLFHTRLAHVSEPMKEKRRGARPRPAVADGAGRRRRHADRREPRHLQPLACGARHPFAHLRDDRLRRLRDRRRERCSAARWRSSHGAAAASSGSTR